MKEEGSRRRRSGGQGGRVGSAKRGEDEHHSITNTPYYSVRKSENPMRTYRHFFLSFEPSPNSRKSLLFGETSLLSSLQGAMPPSHARMFWDLVCFVLRPLPHRLLSDLFWTLQHKADVAGESVPALELRCNIASIMARSLLSSPNSILVPPAQEIKCFLLLSHVMHLPEALLRFSLWGIVCVKTTEMKALQYLLFPTPGRPSGARPFCIPATKC